MKGRANVLKLFRYAGVIAVIVFCEMLVPSTKATGLVPPAPPTPVRQLADVSSSTDGLTYQSLANLAPWLWQTGDITRSDLAARIDADLAYAMAARAALQSAKPGEHIGWQARKRLTILEIYSVAADKAQNALESMFTSPKISGARADLFMADMILQAKADLVGQREQRQKRASRNLAEFSLANGGAEVDTTSPDYIALRDVLVATINDVSDFRLAGSDLSSLQTDLRNVAQNLPASGQQVPTFDGPLIMFENNQTHRITDAQFQSDTALPTTTPLSERLVDALGGRQRNPDKYIVEERCGIIIAKDRGDPDLRRICEIAIPLPVSYDLTGIQCGATPLTNVMTAGLTLPGTRVARDLCKETWLHPHLNIVFTGDSFTVHTPRPTGPDGRPLNTAPLSEWFVTWQGVEKPADPIATFDWDGVTPVLAGLTLRHDAQPHIISPKRWRDFRALTDAASIIAAISGDAVYASQTGWTPFVVKGIDWRSLSPAARAFLARDTATQDQLDSLEFALATRLTTLSILGNTADTNRPCHTNLMQTGVGASFHQSVLKPDVTAVLGNTGCAGIIAYGAVLNGLQRDLFQGNWIWMIARKQFIIAPKQ
jgi:hypothetical protein